MSRYQNWVGLIFFTALLTIPFIVPTHTAPIPSFYHEWLSACCIAGLTTTLLRKQPVSVSMELPVPIWFFICFILLVFLQIALGKLVYPSQGRLAIVYALGAILLLLSVRQLRQEIGLEQLTVYCAAAILVSGLLGSTIAILQYWEIHSWLDPFVSIMGRHARAYGNLAQSNHFGDQQSLALAALLLLLGKRHLRIWMGLLLAPPLLIGLSLSGSKSVLLYLSAIAVLSGLAYLRLRSPESRRLLQLASLIIPAFFGVQYALQSVTGDKFAAEHTLALLTTGGGTLQIRLIFFAEAWQTFLAAPILGSGFQTFAWQHFMLQAASPDPLFFSYEQFVAENTHNLVLHFLAEFGLVGGGLLLLLGIWLYRVGRDNNDLEHWMILTMLVILLLHSMLEYPLFYLHFLAIAVILMGMAKDAPLIKISANLLTVLVLPALLLGGGLLAAMYRAHDHLQDIYGGTSGRIVLDASSQYKLIRADAGGFFEPRVDHILSLVNIDLDKPEDKKMQLRVIERIARHTPTANHIYRYIFLLWVNGRQSEAKNLLEMANRTYPTGFIKFCEQTKQLSIARPRDTNILDLKNLCNEL